MSAKIVALEIKRCSKCRKPRDRNGRYCKHCHAAYMRKHRPAYSEMSEEQRRKSISRAYAGVYMRRGRLKKRPCDDCGSNDSEKHHPDYTKPLFIVWLCRKCHLALHKRFHVEPFVRKEAA